MAKTKKILALYPDSEGVDVEVWTVITEDAQGHPVREVVSCESVERLPARGWFLNRELTDALITKSH